MHEIFSDRFCHYYILVEINQQIKNFSITYRINEEKAYTIAIIKIILERHLEIDIFC